MSRGLTPAVPLHLDRRLLASRSPPRPRFPHIEHSPPPSLKTPLPVSDTTFSTFKLARDQIHALKQKCNNNNDDNDNINGKSKFTTYEVVSGHVWRSVTAARGLPRDQETKLQIPVDGRPRLRPPVPPEYLGNGIFYTGAFALCGELESEPLRFAVGKLHDAIARMDNEYLRSALDFMELHRDAIVQSETTVNCPNIIITSWLRLPFYQVDFGWGKPVYAGAGEATFDGNCSMCADLGNEGSIYIAITLNKLHMKRFAKFFYDEFVLLSKI